MRRRLFTVAAGASAVLCAAVCVLWVRSYWWLDNVEHTGPAEVLCASEAGQLILMRSYPGEVGIPSPENWSAHSDLVVQREDFDFTNGEQFRYRWPGFELASYRPAGDAGTAAGVPGANMRYWFAAVPHWSLAAVLAAPAVLGLWRRSRGRHRDRQGHCPSCGYDLRATPERCPECGAVPAKGAAA